MVSIKVSVCLALEATFLTKNLRIRMFHWRILKISIRDYHRDKYGSVSESAY